MAAASSLPAAVTAARSSPFHLKTGGNEDLLKGKTSRPDEAGFFLYLH
jgi:hypothetical protein